MIEYDATLNGIIDCFSDAVSKSDGTKESMLTHFDIFRFKRLAMIDYTDEFLPHDELIKKLHFRSNWKHELHKEIIRAKPRSAQHGVIYLDYGSVLGNWSDLDFVAALIQKPHKSYLFIRMEYHPKDKCIHNLYSCNIEQLANDTFNLMSVEGRVDKTLAMLYNYVK